MNVVLLGRMQTWLVCQMIFPPMAAVAAGLAMSSREHGFRREHILRSIIVFGLAAGTTTHVLMLLRLMPVPSAPAAGYHWFWTTLTFVDPLIAAAIVFAPRVGLAAAIVLMISDVGVNVTASGGFNDWAIWLQSAFALFVLAATPSCWNRPMESGVRIL